MKKNYSIKHRKPFKLCFHLFYENSPNNLSLDITPRFHRPLRTLSSFYLSENMIQTFNSDRLGFQSKLNLSEFGSKS